MQSPAAVLSVVLRRELVEVKLSCKGMGIERLEHLIGARPQPSSGYKRRRALGDDRSRGNVGRHPRRQQHSGGNQQQHWHNSAHREILPGLGAAQASQRTEKITYLRDG